MSIVSRTLKYFGFQLIKAASIVERGWTAVGFGSFANTAKEKVNNSTALTVSTVYAAIRNISEDVAKLPLKIYQKENAYMLEQKQHKAYRLLQYRPNPEMSAMSFRATLNGHAMGWGNGYAFIERDGNGDIRYLWPLRPDSVKIYRDTERGLFYEVTARATGHTQTFWPREIFHIPGFGDSGVAGYNIIQYMAEQVASAIAIGKFSSGFFGNGLNQSGHIKHPNTLTQPVIERLKKQVQEQHTTAANAHKLLVLEEGMEFVPNMLDPKAAQMIESRQYLVTEFCRWIRIQPHKVAHLENATFSNIEHQNTDYVVDSLSNWCTRWEQELWAKLLTPQEKRGGFCFKHNLNALLRGDVQTRNEAYSKMLDRGVMTINEVRSLEDMNPVDGGDQHLVPLNFTTLDKIGQPAAFVSDAAARIYQHEQSALASAKNKHGDKFDSKLFAEHFNSKHEKYIEAVLKPFGIQPAIKSLATAAEIETIIRGVK